MAMINPSRHLQLIHANEFLVGLVNKLADQPGVRLTTEESSGVAEVIKLDTLAKAEMVREGLTIERPKPGAVQ